MRKVSILILFLIILFLSIGIYLDIKNKKVNNITEEISEESTTIQATTTQFTSTPIIIPEIIPTLEISPKIIYQGDPVFIKINASSSPVKLLFNNKVIPIVKYNDQDIAFLGIDFREEKEKHLLRLELSNGEIITDELIVTMEKKEERPVGIPEKLGGNTPEAGKALIDNIVKENASINSTRTELKSLWEKPFVSPLKTLFITDPYGYNRNTTGYTLAHKGTDFRAPEGTEIMSMNDGIVRLSRKYTLSGNTILIDHGLGISTIYMHLSKLMIKEGDTVKAGQLIGLSGQTGYVNGAHLHLAVKLHGVSIDPEKFMKFFNIL